MIAVRLLALLLASALLLTGCKGQCHALADKLCECTAANNFERQQCLGRNGELSRTARPTAEEEAQCGKLLESCNCDLIDTPQGKQACGLAR